MSKFKKVVIVGATSAIAEHCARLWVQKQDNQGNQDKPVDLVLLGRNSEKLEKIAADLRVRSPKSTIQILTPEFFDPMIIQKTVDTIIEQGPVDLVLIAQGFLPEQQDCQKDLKLCRDTLEITAISPVIYAEAFAFAFENANHGTIAIIGSVAGDRGRKSNYVYGSAKSLIKGYAQGLQHRFAGTNVNVILINPGPTDTPMTIKYKEKGMKMASVEAVAEKIVEGIDKGKSTIYVPGIWLVIMWVVRHLPSFIFNKINI